jgi:hypothetical protein
VKWRLLAAVVAVVLLATLMPVSVGAQDVQFDDVPARHTFFDEISWLAAQGITEGCNAERTSFCPGLAVTRGQMAAFLVRGLQIEGTPQPEFDDVANGHTFYREIGLLAEDGITEGCNTEGTLFCPDDVVTRQQMAAFLSRALYLRNDGGGNSFIDDDGSSFETEIAMLAHAGITQGCDASGELFCPLNTVTRGQMAAFLSRGIPLLYWGEVTVTGDAGIETSSSNTYEWAWGWIDDELCTAASIDEPIDALGGNCLAPLYDVLCVTWGGAAVFAGGGGVELVDTVSIEMVPPATKRVEVSYSNAPDQVIDLRVGTPAFARVILDTPGWQERDILIEAFGENGNLLGTNFWDASETERTRTCNTFLPAVP